MELGKYVWDDQMIRPDYNKQFTIGDEVYNEVRDFVSNPNFTIMFSIFIFDYGSDE